MARANKTKYLYLVDQEKKDQTGNGRIMFKQSTLKQDGTEKTPQEIQQHFQQIRLQMAKKNADYQLARAYANGNVHEVTKLSFENNKIIEKKNPIPLDLNEVKEPILSLTPNTGNTFAIIGSSKRGKSTLAIYIYKKLQDQDKNLISILFAKNPQATVYKKLPKKLIITSDLHEDVINTEQQINKISKNKFNFLNIIDDFIRVKQDTIDELILTYRNSNISTIIALQYSYLLSKQSRNNTNNVFLFGMNTDEAISDTIKIFLTSYYHNRNINDLPSQIADYREATRDHRFFHIIPETGYIKLCKLNIDD